MRKILLLLVIISATASVSGCGFSALCGCSTCCTTASCCGSDGWY